MANYDFTLVYGVNGSKSYPLARVQTATYKCKDESYIEDPLIRMIYRYEDTSGSPKYGFVAANIESITRTSTIANYGYRCAFALDKLTPEGRLLCYNNPQLNSSWGSYTVKYGNSQDNPDPSTPNTATGSNFPNTGSYLIRWDNARITQINTWNLSTNIPVFETSAEASAYIESGSQADLKKAVNYEIDAQQNGEDFVINNVWAHGTWTPNGLTGMQGQNFRQVKGRLVEGGRISFYPKSGITDGSLQYGVLINGSFDGLQYSEDGGNIWIDTDTFPYTFFYRERESELGTFNFGLSFYSQIPVFEDEETAEKYNDEDPSVSIEDAINWPQISGHYPIDNTTGDKLTASEFGHARFQAVFSQQYILDITCLQEIAADLYDTSNGGIWESIKKGLDMYGDNPIEAVMGLTFWPISISSILKPGSTVSAQYIWFGGYGWDVSGHSGSATQIIYPDNEIIIGTIRISPSFGGSFRDYEPYTKLYVTLPYCGVYQLDLARYMDRDVQVKYYIDTRTGGCLAVLSVLAEGGWYCTDYFNGQMGISLPITLTNFSDYARSQLQILLQGGGQASQSLGSGVDSVIGAGGGASLAGAALGAAGGAGIAGALVGAKTVYGLSQNNKNNFNKTKGGSSAMINCFLPQTVDFLFEIQEDCAPSNYGKLCGYPSMAAGTVNSFSGFLKCQAVKLECNTATEREKERIKQMLLSGIYI